MKRLAVAVVLFHAAVLAGHDLAHRNLGVGLAPWQELFAYSVIVAAPFAALALLAAGRSREGFALLSAAMLGSLVFGGYHHYVAISPDHVAHLPAGDSRGLFQLSAALMAGLEAAGIAVGLVGMRRSRAAPLR